MENENKEKTILTDEELQEVAGGKKISAEAVINEVRRICVSRFCRDSCMRNGDCAWISNRCLPNPNRYDYDYKSEI
jgi:hypothetical protein